MNRFYVNSAEPESKYMEPNHIPFHPDQTTTGVADTN